jgi:hypothetical protein
MCLCSLYDITKMRVGICLNVLYVILVKWKMSYECSYDITNMSNSMCLNALYVILIKRELAYVGILFI